MGLETGEHLGIPGHSRALEFWQTLNPIERQRYLSVPVSELLQKAKELDKRRQAAVKHQVDSLVTQRESAGAGHCARLFCSRLEAAACVPGHICDIF